MIHPRHCGGLMLLLSATFIHAQPQAAPPFNVPEEITFRSADIISEGTRMAAEVFAPKKPAQGKLPTIIMCHGWGGLAQNLRPDAMAFAKAGYLVITFNYRGWGNSDARLILAGQGPKKQNGQLLAEVKEVRGIVDPVDQTTDLLNAIHWAVAEDRCDPERIGLWGSSYSGGHVVYAAARDPRIKAFVSQVPSLDSRWVLLPPDRDNTFQQGSDRTRGKQGYPPPGVRFRNLTGAPILEKLMHYAPIEDIDRCHHCAKLFIIAEHEELFDNKEHAILAHDRATGVKKLVTLKGIRHYGIYLEKRQEAQKLAIDWFDQHLKP